MLQSVGLLLQRIQTLHSPDCTLKTFWYQQIDLRQCRILRGGRPIVDIDAADKCCLTMLHVKTMKAMKFQDDISSFSIDIFKDHHILVFDLTSMQDGTESIFHPKLVGEPLRLELNFNFPLEHVTELIELGERVSSAAVDKLSVAAKYI